MSKARPGDPRDQPDNETPDDATLRATGEDDHPKEGDPVERSPSPSTITYPTELSDQELAVLTLFHRLNFGNKPPSKKGRQYPNVFEVDEDFIVKIDKRVRERIAELPTWPRDFVGFHGSVGFPDLSRQEFDDLSVLLDRAGEQKDPERLVLEWRVILSEPYGGSAAVVVAFVTEQPLDTQKLELLEYHNAYMELEVEGPAGAWVDTTFRTIDSYLLTARLGGIYRPLLIFRSPDFVRYASWAAGLVGQVTSITLLERIFFNQSAQQRLAKILNQPNLDKKFDAFVHDVLSENSPLYQSILVFGGSFVIFVIFVVAGYVLFPRLVPRSTIEVGLARVRAARYRNVFKFFVFTLLLCGIILPIIVNIASSILTHT